MEDLTIYPVGEYSFMRNDYPVLLILDGVVWYSAECAYQAYRVSDKAMVLLIRDLPYKTIREYEECFTPHENWEQIKDEILYYITKEKFEQHSNLADKLLATGDAIIKDGFLGDILMRVRKEIRDKR